MYGMMFGDVGHGILLALAGVWLARRQGSLSWLGRIIVAVGVSGTLFGLLYGSLFGREDILPHLWLNPFDNIMAILLVSLGAGVILLCVGFFLSLATSWRSRDWGMLLFGETGLAGLVLYVSLTGGGVALLQGIAPPMPWWLLIVLASAAMIWFREPLSRIVEREPPFLEGGGVQIVQSFFELFETLISYFTNSLSFVRLGAFAIAHAGLSQVVLILSEGTSGLLRWLIIVLGALVIVGFEGLIVGIQTLRLEYYEFFGRFFQGGGVPFEPFGMNTGEEA
jgi:V/A-type H+-transporting ATPase subunit I